MINKTYKLTSNDIVSKQKMFYAGLLDTYDIYSQNSISWFDGGQLLRFRELLKIIPDRIFPYNLLDVGCGLGDMYNYIRKSRFLKIKYTGIHALDEMVNSGRKKYPGINILHREFLSDSSIGKYDILTCSGAINVKLFRSEERQLNYIKLFIKKLFDLSAVGCSFNMLSREDSRHFRNDDDIYYAGRKRIYEISREFCRDVELIYKSEIFGFTVYMRR
jgi:SAM-dependent methyltransferase